MTIINRIKKTIEENSLIEKGDLIILGASGGPDSQFLAYALNDLRKDFDFDLVLAHFNHLHRKEAIEDERLVKETAQKLDLTFKSRSASMDEYAKKLKISPEDAGRRLRYEFFRSLKKDGKAKIAVAHTLDDQAETVLMRIVRGTGVEGLRAMAYKNDDIIRPILDIKKEELLLYLDRENIPYHIDKTNGETDYTRNKIRLDVIPELESINPNFKEALVKLSHIACDEIAIKETHMEKIYQKILTESGPGYEVFDKNNFEKLKKEEKASLLRMAISRIKGEVRDISKENIDTFLSLEDLQTGKEIIKDDLIFRKSYKTYILSLDKKRKKTTKLATISLGEEVNFEGYKIRVSRVDSLDKKKTKTIAYFDEDKLTFPLKLRFRENGDSFRPFGMKHRKKLKDLFIDAKVDRVKRDRIPLVLSDDKIIWVTGLRSSEDFKVDPWTKNIVKIEVENDY